MAALDIPDENVPVKKTAEQAAEEADDDCEFCGGSGLTEGIKHDHRGRPIEKGFDGVYATEWTPCMECRPYAYDE